jgi:cytochrome c-type biogenesis protein
MEFSAPSLGLAFLAGLASFLSPCVFALVPAYISYLGGRSVSASAKRARSATWETIRHGAAFVLGFSVVFILLGLISSSIGALLQSLQGVLAKIGGVTVIVLGLHLSGILHLRFLDYELRPKNQVARQRSYLSSALMGVFFSAGWTPCIGPVLGVILTLAANGGSPAQGALLLTAYSAGLAIPFMLAATQISWVTFLLRRYSNAGLWIQRAMGLVLVAVGVLLFTGRLSTLSSLGFFFDIFEEGRIGVALLIAMLASLLLGLGAGWWARQSGKPFAEYWFLGTGVC